MNECEMCEVRLTEIQSLRQLVQRLARRIDLLVDEKQKLTQGHAFYFESQEGMPFCPVKPPEDQL